MDEILLSGWHFGAMLLFLRSSRKLEQFAGPWAPDPMGLELRLLQQLEALPLAANIRVQQDVWVMQGDARYVSIVP
eukprot:symbB.v1.2.012598.t1/scaffold820.1/size171332/5